MIRDPVAQIEAAEPAIREVQMDLFAQPPFRPDAEAIANQQHPDQQFGIDRRAAGMAVETGKMGADAAQIDKPVDGSKQVIHGDVILKRELVEKCCLSFLSRSQHCSILPLARRIESATYASIKHEFFNKISPYSTYNHCLARACPGARPTLPTGGRTGAVTRRTSGLSAMASPP